MKKTISFLAGLVMGLIFIAGGFENCSAEDYDSVFRRYHFSSDSSETLSLEQRGKSNVLYLKTDQIQSDKSAGKFILGGFGALGGGMATAALAYGIRCLVQEGYHPWYDDAGGIELLAGYLIGSNLGCATSVYLVGRSGGDRGSYSSALGGSLGGTLLGMGGLVLTAALTHSAIPSLFAFHAGQAWGATRAFNRSSKAKMNRTSSQALLSLGNEKLTLEFPQVEASQNTFCSTHYKVNFFEAKF